MTAQGNPRRIFQTAIERGNIVMAEAAARELGRIITLHEALQLTALVAEKDPKRRSRFRVRWLRWLLEDRRSSGGGAWSAPSGWIVYDRKELIQSRTSGTSTRCE